MDIDQKIKQCFGKVKNLPCWGVDTGQGSMLGFEFGEPSLSIREPKKPNKDMSEKTKMIISRRKVSVNGEWYLWIYCCDWVVKDKRKIIGDSSSKEKIKDVLGFLDGQKLINVSFRARGCKTIFEFDLGGILETKPYDTDSEQWLFYEPSGKVLALRADKMFSYSHGDTPREDEKWRTA